MIGVVTKSLEPGPTAGTRSVWEKNRLYSSAHITHLLVQKGKPSFYSYLGIEFTPIPKEQTLNLNLYIFKSCTSSVHTGSSSSFFVPVMNSHSDASLCITMEKRETEEEN